MNKRKQKPIKNNDIPTKPDNKQFIQKTVQNIRNIDNFRPGVSPVTQFKKYYNYERKYAVECSRMMYSNSSIYRSVIDTMVDLCIGTDGFLINVKTKNDDLNNKVKNYFYNYFKNPEVSNRYHGKEFEKRIFQEYLITGESWLLKTNKGLQIIYSEEVDDVVYDDLGKVSEIKVKTAGNDYKTIKADDLIFTINYEANSDRGYPILTSAITIILRLHGVLESEAFNWNLLARIPLVSKRNDSANQVINEGGKVNSVAPEVVQRELLMDYGLIFNCEPDETLEVLSRNLPQNNLQQSVLVFLRAATSITGIPAELLMNDLSQYNYSQSRLVVERAKSKIKNIQNNFIYSIYDEITKFIINQMKRDKVLTNEMFSEDNTLNSITWVAPIPFSEYMEKNEIDNNINLVKYGYCTATEMLQSKYGRDRKEVLDQRVMEIEDAINRINKINEKYGTNLDVSILLGSDVTTSNTNINNNGEVKNDQ